MVRKFVAMEVILEELMRATTGFYEINWSSLFNDTYRPEDKVINQLYSHLQSALLALRRLMELKDVAYNDYEATRNQIEGELKALLKNYLGE